MKKFLLVSLLLVATLWLASCGSEAPLTEAEQAEKYNMSTAEYKEMKDAAARMNMTIEEHMKHTSTDGDSSHDMMDMSDDSHMIEDDMEMNDTEMSDVDMHMETMHEWEDIDDHGSDEHGKHE